MEKDLIYIDTHSHLYDEAFKDDVEEAVERAVDAGVRVILQPDTDSRERERMFRVTGSHPEVFRCMAGLYPGSVDEGWEKEVAEVEKAATRPEVVAIGEIGLDYHYSKDTADLQMKALRSQFGIAARLGLPVNIHERDATEDFFRVLDECRSLGLRGNMHAFSGSYETFLRLQKYGDWSIGVGGVVTFKNSRLAETVKKVPLDRIVLETDSPYLTPAPFRGKRNESSYIPIIAEKIAELKGITPGEVAETTTSNAERLFGISVAAISGQ